MVDVVAIQIAIFFAAPLVIPWFFRGSKRSCWVTYCVIVAIQISIVVLGFWYLDQQYINQTEGALDGPEIFAATFVNGIVVFVSAVLGLISTIIAVHRIEKK